MLKKIITALTAALVLLRGCAAGNDNKSETESEDMSKNISIDNEKIINVGIAWRKNPEQSLGVFEKSIEKAGGKATLLGQVKADGFDYGEDNSLDGKYLESGMLKLEYAEIIKTDTYKNSNIEEIMDGVDAVIVPGGADICPTLLKIPEGAKNNGEGFDATRDISDYLLLSYCIDNDIPVYAICRGMQMLGVVSGATLIQDIGNYCKENGIDYADTHRMPAGTPNRDYTRHNIEITDENSHIFEIIGSKKFENITSWHHQAVGSVEGTNLKVTAINETDGLTVIEAIERTDKTFIIGLQPHPEAIAKKYVSGEDDVCDGEICQRFVDTLVEYARRK